MSQNMQFTALPEQCHPYNMMGSSSHSRHSPGSIDIGMGDLGSSVGTDGQAFGHYASMSTTGQEHRGMLSNLQPQVGSLAAFVQQPSRYDLNLRMHLFVRDEDASWNPLKANAVSGAVAYRGRQPSGLPFDGHMIPDFTDYRDNTAPSDCDTIGPGPISDSGYGSMARQSVGSVGNRSVFGDLDHSTDAQAIVRGVSEIQFQSAEFCQDTNSTREKISQRKPWEHQVNAASSNFDGNGLSCLTCHAKLKTKSELNKHKQRHEKPFKCDEPGCSRSVGFSTHNDLTRHKQCVHKATGIRYRCHLDQCQTKEKDWPRADNFRQHLKRVHGRIVSAEDDLNCFIYRPAEPRQVESRVDDLAGLVPSDVIAPQLNLDTGPSLQSHWAGQIESGSPSGSSPDILQFPTHQPLMDEQAISPLASAGGNQWQMPNSSVHTNPPLEMDHMLSTLGTSERSTPEPESASEAASNSSHPFINPGILGPRTAGSVFPGVSQEAPESQDESLGPETDDESVCCEDTQTRSPADTLELSGQPAQVKAHKLELDNIDQDQDSEDGDADHDDDMSHYSGEGRTRHPLIHSHNTDHTGVSGTNTPRPNLNHIVDDVKSDLGDEDAMLKQLLDNKGLLDKLLAKVGYKKAPEPEPELKKSQSIPMPTCSGNQSICPHPQCGKSFHRPCELKKHLKRHEKPYPCTFPQCGKRFGSKNDWKRHENSQHFQRELWRCEKLAKGDPHRPCGRVSYTRESFKCHLEKEHQVLDTREAEKLLASCRIGRNCESRYWCGFCVRTIDFKNNGALAWTERFDHIEAHLNGRDKFKPVDIKEWKDVDHEVTATTTTTTATTMADVVVLDGKPKEVNFDRRKQRGTTSLQSSVNKSLKRRRVEEDNVSTPRPSRRARIGSADQVYRAWNCCECHNMCSLALNDTCVSCNHSRCVDCRREDHTVTAQ